MFSRPEIKDLLNRYTKVQLYTDVVPAVFQPAPSAAENRRFQEDRFGNLQLPLYVILEPVQGGDFREVTRYEEGLINDIDGFARFLREPLNQQARKVAGPAQAKK